MESSTAGAPLQLPGIRGGTVPMLGSPPAGAEPGWCGYIKRLSCASASLIHCGPETLRSAVFKPCQIYIRQMRAPTLWLSYIQLIIVNFMPSLLFQVLATLLGVSPLPIHSMAQAAGTAVLPGGCCHPGWFPQGGCE